MNRAAQLIVISDDQSDGNDEAVAKLAEMVGVQVDRHTANSANNPSFPVDADRRHLACSCSTYGRHAGERWFDELANRCASILIYGFSPANCSRALRLFGAIVEAAVASPLGSREVRIHSVPDETHSPMAGRSYCFEAQTATGAFRMGVDGAMACVHISENDLPMFVSFPHGGARIYLLAGSSLVDIDTELIGEQSLRPFYAQLVAMAGFLRAAFGDQCWSNPVTPATLMIDDPSLARRYGFVEYESLLPEIKHAGAALNIAFIPYNHKRTDARVADLGRCYGSCFSISVHGCDHSQDEFGSHDAQWMFAKTQRAVALMERHALRTGMPYDKVMVFPQDVFSAAGVEALKRNHFVAALTNTLWPEDEHAKPPTIRDLLDVAVTRYSNFSIFVRRYPAELIELAFDAFFLKPIFVVEHHGWFRNGYGVIGDIVEKLGTIGEKLQWMPLGKALAKSYLIRQSRPGHYDVKAYTPVVLITNPSDRDCLFSLEKAEADNVAVETVMVGKSAVPFSIEGRVLRVEFRLGPNEEQEVRVNYHSQPTALFKPPLQYRARIFARRALSDFRDNYLARNEKLLSLAVKLKKRVFKRGSIRQTNI